MTDRCLTDEEISAYVDGAVDAALRTRIEKHLADCPVCLHNVAELKLLVGQEDLAAAAPSAEALLRAEALIAEYAHKAHQFDVLAALRGGVCRVIETTGDMLTPRRLSTVPIRGDRGAGLNPRIAKSLSGYLVTIELSAEGDSLQARLNLMEEATSKRPDGVKARLYSKGACETKYTEGGRTSFRSLGSGTYRIDVEDIGTIGLEVRGPAT
jgi:hypothetical protein